MKQEPKYPDFIGIGAARSGTTWLFKNLESHAGVWLPRIKELHYFSRDSKYIGPSHLQEYHWGKRMLSADPKFAKFRGKLFKSIGSNLLKPSWRKLSWDYNYLVGRPSDQWYGSLFAQGAGKLTGEITPAYSVLDTGDIEGLLKLIPNVKIVFMVRNPIERSWSLVRYHEKRSRDARTTLPVARLIELVEHPAIVAQNDFLAILKRWRSLVPEGQFFLGFYDEISDCPHDLLRRLGTFLELDFSAGSATGGAATKVFNGSDEKDMPKELYAHFCEKYREPIARLSEEYGGYFSKWHQSVRITPQVEPVLCGH